MPLYKVQNTSIVQNTSNVNTGIFFLNDKGTLKEKTLEDQQT